jgi:kynureninase
VLQLAALEAALQVWDGIAIADLRARSLELTDAFIAGVEAACPTLTLATPREHRWRGSQVSFRHPEGFAIMQALIARGVIGDFRAPDIMRFGICPLFNTEAEIRTAASAIAAPASSTISAGEAAVVSPSMLSQRGATDRAAATIRSEPSGAHSV